MSLTLPLLRSVIRCSSADDETHLRVNLTTLRTEVAPEGIDRELLAWLGSVSERAGKVPDLTLARAYYTSRMGQGFPDGPPAISRLDEIIEIAPTQILLSESQFRVVLDAYIEDVMRSMTTAVMIESANILRSGIQQRKRVNGQYQMVTVQGVRAAVRHLQEGIATIGTRLKQGAVHGSFQSAMDDIITTYERAARNPGANVGVLSGISQIDNAHRGLKRGELALVLGFTGHMKSTFCLNWYYKAAVLQQKNVAIVPLESNVELTRLHLVALHATHPKFEFDLSKIRLTSPRLREGVLTAEERLALTDVTDDLRSGDYGLMLYKQPGERVTVDDIRQWLEEEQQRNGKAIDMVVIDYLGLVDPDKQSEGLADIVGLSRAIRKSKSLAMEFDGGKGIGVLSPYQANREGLKEATNAGGRYTLRALAGTPEAERSADYVYYLYLDDALRNARELAVGNIKTRDVQMITEQFRVFADASVKLIDNLSLGSTHQEIVEGGVSGVAS